MERGKHPKDGGWKTVRQGSKTPAIEKDVARYKSKLRGLANKQTGKVDRPGATVRLQLAL